MKNKDYYEYLFNQIGFNKPYVITEIFDNTKSLFAREDNTVIVVNEMRLAICTIPGSRHINIDELKDIFMKLRPEGFFSMPTESDSIIDIFKNAYTIHSKFALKDELNRLEKRQLAEDVDTMAETRGMTKHFRLLDELINVFTSRGYHLELKSINQEKAELSKNEIYVYIDENTKVLYDIDAMHMFDMGFHADSEVDRYTIGKITDALEAYVDSHNIVNPSEIEKLINETGAQSDKEWQELHKKDINKEGEDNG